MQRFTLPALLLLTVSSGWSFAGEPQPGKPAGGEFARDVLPFIEKHCLACHNPEKKKANLILSAYRDEATIGKDRVVWQAVARMVHTGEMPPSSRPRPAVEDAERFTKALGVLFDRADGGKRDPGHITIRRLNRTEYNNTIQDLIGIDFQPAEDFPSDDVGYGFDNIGDVLSLSPVLMERYFTAAESIVQRAVLVEPPKIPQRPAAATFLQPRGTVREPPVRELSKPKESLYFNYRLTAPGEYIFRVRAWDRPADKADKEPPRIALLIDGKTVATLDVKNTEERGGSHEVALNLKEGTYRAEVQLLNPGPLPFFAEGNGDNVEGLKLRTLIVRRFEMEGPKDSYPASHKKILACNPKATHAEQTREILTRFASKAYRRPATKEEVDRLAKLVESTEKRGEKWEAGIRLALEAVLVSPKFLFRVELDNRSDNAGPHPIDEFQLASRLSYFLWSTMPDDELFDLAAKKQLTANLDAQVKRMLKDPRSKALTENFALQWLQLRRLSTFTPDPKLFPKFDERLRSAMLKETEKFFDAVMHEDRSILDFLDADYTFVNRRLAEHYGIADTNGNRIGQKATKPEGDHIWGDRFVRVQLQGGERGGLLTQASILAVTSDPTRTSPVKRGKWVLEQLLGTPPPPPPPNVPQLEDKKRQLTGSLRQRLEQHRVDPGCANCHARMDPLGFGLENYDALGAFRTKDEGYAIDASGTLPDGKSFKGPGELKKILLAKKDQFTRCLTEKMMIYALGRGLEYYDQAAVDRINTALAKDNYRFSVLVTEIVKSDPFRLKRGKQ